MSLWLQAVTEALERRDYRRFREHLLPIAPMPVPGCLARELEFGETRCSPDTEDRLFPIRFLWLMEGHEQRLWGYVPLGRSRYHPEKLIEIWQHAIRDAAHKNEMETQGFRFDLMAKAMESTAGWIYIGDRFIEDFLEVESALGIELLFPDPGTGERRAAFPEIKRQRADGKLLDRFRGCLLGLATGDALGTTLEFRSRGSFAPLSDMIGGGPFHLQPGEWTDDTSLGLCLATSLVECRGFDAADQMDRYCRWAETGYLSSNGRCFDIGRTTAQALRRYGATGDPFAGPTEPTSAGNGSIMRLAPVPMFYFSNVDAAVSFAAESSRTTHGAPECLEACRILAAILRRALSGCGKEEVLVTEDSSPSAEGKLAAIARGSYRRKSVDEIRGSGYVVESLEAALWCFHRTEGFEAAVLAAANLGDDADTTAAICGQVAGAYYGASSIPEGWLARLAMRREITELADRLYEAGTGTIPERGARNQGVRR